jgi:hypothetical protein
MGNGQPNRRWALRVLATGAVGAAASSGWVESLSALAQQHAHLQSSAAAMTAQDWKPRVLTGRQNDQVVALSELIIPETDTPGAKAVLVNRFIDDVLRVAQPDERNRFLRGLAWMDSRSKALSGKDLLTASPADQTALLTRLAATDSKEDRIGIDFFRAIKAMTINGYYTTEIGLRRELGDSGQLFLPQFQGCEHPEHL